jgi:hypothetical protein
MGPTVDDPCGSLRRTQLGRTIFKTPLSPFTPLHREDLSHISAAGSVHFHASRLPISQTRLLKFTRGAPVTTLFTAISESARTASPVALPPGADPFPPNANDLLFCTLES